MHMHRPLICVCFCAGVLGALVNSYAAWQAGVFGLTGLLGVKLAPVWALPWLYPRLVWGGLWGLAYFVTVAPSSSRHGWIRKGLWISLLPTAYQLFVVFPYQTSHGTGGLGLGTLTPLAVLLLNAIWGAATGISARLLAGR